MAILSCELSMKVRQLMIAAYNKILQKKFMFKHIGHSNTTLVQVKNNSLQKFLSDGIYSF